MIRTNPVNVVLVNSDLEFGGAQRQLVELANNLEPDKYKVYVCSLADYVPLADSLTNREEMLHIIKKKNKYDVTVIWKLANLFRTLQADIVHAYLFDAQIMTRLSRLLNNRPVIIGSERNTNYTLPKKNLLAYKYTQNLFDIIIANSRAGAQFNSTLIGTDIARYRVVHNGVDLHRFHPDFSKERNRLSDNGKLFIVGMFASFKQQKNHHYLIDAVPQIIKKVPNTRFVFVGDELYKGMSDSVEYKKSIMQKIAQLGIQKYCIFEGNKNDVESFYNACDITVLPSLFEGTPNVALESMACGVPIVATDVSDNSYVIPHEKCGFIVPLNNKETLSIRIVTLLENEQLRTIMKNQARSWVEKEFSTKRLAEKTAVVYEEGLILRKQKNRAKKNVQNE